MSHPPIVAKSKEHLQQIIEYTIDIEGVHCNLNFIDVAAVRKLDFLFSMPGPFKKFNGIINKWNVSNVENMSFMFSGSEFKGDLSEWDVSNVTNMNYMFNNSVFSGSIDKWDVSSVQKMRSMFRNSLFDKNISKWNVSNVKSMRGLFSNSTFNGSLETWNISLDTDIDLMIDSARLCNFDGPTVYHWLSVIRDPSLINNWQHKWQAHFHSFFYILRGLDLTDMQAAILIQKNWLNDCVFEEVIDLNVDMVLY